MAFHSYPRLIRKLFNAYRFGPPGGVTRLSAWARVDHPVSRLPWPTSAPSSGSLSLRLRACWRLASPATATRRLIMQKARRHRIAAAPTACGRMVSGSFSLLCPRFFSPFPHGTRPLSLPEVLFTFPSRYSSTVGLPVVFSLAGWSPRFRAGFLVSCATQVAALPPVSVSPTGLSPSPAGVSTPFGYEPGGFLRPLLLPRRARRHAPGLGSSAFARRYSRNHCCFLLLRVLRCFSSPRWPHS